MARNALMLIMSLVLAFSVQAARADGTNAGAEAPQILGALQTAEYRELSAADMARTVGTRGFAQVDAAAFAFAEGILASTSTSTDARTIVRRNVTIAIGRARASAEASGPDAHVEVGVVVNAVAESDSDSNTFTFTRTNVRLIERPNYARAVATGFAIAIAH